MTSHTPASIRNLVDANRAAGSALEQPIRWKPAAWKRPHLGAIHAEIEAAETLSEELENGWRQIRRKHVIMLDSELGLGPRGVFAGAMVWGFGPIGYGAARTARMMDSYSSDVFATRLEGYSAAAANGPGAAWDAIFARDTKIRFLGPAFGTKLAYFLARAAEPQPSPLPLIADLNTSWAVWDLCGIPRSAYGRRNYLHYVDTAHQWAAELRCPVDEIELALFQYGKDVPR